MPIAFLAALVLVSLQTPVAVPLDLTAVEPGPISVVRSDNAVTVPWPDETKPVWRATFSLDPSQPLITSIGPEGEQVVRGARPFYRGETGKRRGGWYAFFDDPTSHADGTGARVSAKFGWGGIPAWDGLCFRRSAVRSHPEFVLEYEPVRSGSTPKESSS